VEAAAMKAAPTVAASAEAAATVATAPPTTTTSSAAVGKGNCRRKTRQDRDTTNQANTHAWLHDRSLLLDHHRDEIFSRRILPRCIDIATARCAAPAHPCIIIAFSTLVAMVLLAGSATDYIKSL
jgi:hypothetical protein